MGILRNIDKIDFTLLYSGKVCVDELPRVRRLARLDCLKLPHFMRDMDEYLKQLRTIAAVNGLLPKPAVVKKSARASARSKCGSIKRHPSSSSHSSRSRRSMGKSSKGCVKDTDSSSLHQAQGLFMNSSDDECDTISSSIGEQQDYYTVRNKSSEIAAMRRNNPSIVDYSYSPSVSAIPSRAAADGSVWMPLEDQQRTRSNSGIVADYATDDIQTVVTLKPQSAKPADDIHPTTSHQSNTRAKSHHHHHHHSSTNSDHHNKLSHTRSPSQTQSASSSAYMWQSTRTPSPSPVQFTLQDDLLGGESPIPYSPARWLRRRKKTAPNVLSARKRENKEDAGELRPISITKLPS